MGKDIRPVQIAIVRAGDYAMHPDHWHDLRELSKGSFVQGVQTGVKLQQKGFFADAFIESTELNSTKTTFVVQAGMGKNGSIAQVIPNRLLDKKFLQETVLPDFLSDVTQQISSKVRQIVIVASEPVATQISTWLMPTGMRGPFNKAVKDLLPQGTLVPGGGFVFSFQRKAIANVEWGDATGYDILSPEAA